MLSLFRIVLCENNLLIVIRDVIVPRIRGFPRL